jgi:hypothetical protein
MTRSTLLLSLLLLVGCKTYDLDEQYKPLTKIVERPSLKTFGVSDTLMSTKGSHVYVADLDKFLLKWPPGSVEFHGRLIHEQVHGRRQFDYLDLPGEMALASWLTRYMTDHEFMWAEEQQAYYVQIKYLKSKGKWSPQRTIQYALVFSKGTYKTIYGKRMCSFAVGKKWIEDVLSGAWTPPPE